MMFAAPEARPAVGLVTRVRPNGHREAWRSEATPNGTVMIREKQMRAAGDAVPGGQDDTAADDEP